MFNQTNSTRPRYICEMVIGGNSVFTVYHNFDWSSLAVNLHMTVTVRLWCPLWLGDCATLKCTTKSFTFSRANSISKFPWTSCSKNAVNTWRIYAALQNRTTLPVFIVIVFYFSAKLCFIFLLFICLIESTQKLRTKLRNIEKPDLHAI